MSRSRVQATITTLFSECVVGRVHRGADTVLAKETGQRAGTSAKLMIAVELLQLLTELAASSARKCAARTDILKVMFRTVGSRCRTRRSVDTSVHLSIGHVKGMVEIYRSVLCFLFLRQFEC